LVVKCDRGAAYWSESECTVDGFGFIEFESSFFVSHRGGFGFCWMLREGHCEGLGWLYRQRSHRWWLGWWWVGLMCIV